MLHWPLPARRSRRGEREVRARGHSRRPCRPLSDVFRIAVLASGTGTNLQAILDKVHGRDGIEVACVAANNPAAMALERASAVGIQTAVFERDEYADREAR